MIEETPDRRAKYEAKGTRPRKLVAVRMSDAEIKIANRVRGKAESIPALLRRLLKEHPKAHAAPKRGGAANGG